MNRMLLLAVAVGVVFAGLNSRAADEKKVTIKAVMKAHKEGQLRDKTIEAVNDKKWDDAAKSAKEWAKLADALPKCKCPKGDADDWKTQTEAYAKCVNTLAKACSEKNARSAQGALNFIKGSCMKCHTAHRKK